MKNTVLLLVCICIVVFFTTKLNSHSASNKYFIKDLPPYIENYRWADSMFSAMSPDERLGQLFMVAAYSNKGAEDKEKITSLINKYKIGGLIFMQGGPVRQAALTNYYQSISATSLLIGIDGEWGLSMRLDSTVKFPRQLMLGALKDSLLIYEMGNEIARECKRIGVNIDFAPVVDINNNPKNPVINDRSFGENKYNVTNKGIAYMKGLQDGGVLACAKHFPGHGNTDKDSHKTLPTVSGSASELDSLELYPFRKIIESGVGSIMVAHLHVPALDSTEHIASTLSKKIVTNLLINKLGFHGLIITDALNMKGVSDDYEPGEVDLKALLAGNDILLFPGNVGAAISEIKKAIADKEISQPEVDAKIKKILQAKYWCGLSKFKKIELQNIYTDLNNPQVLLLKQRLVENTLTLVRNYDRLLPLQNLDTLKLASVAIGESSVNVFQQTLSNYAPIKNYQIAKDAEEATYSKLLSQLKNYNIVFVSLHNMSRQNSTGYGVSEESKKFIEQLQQKTKVVLTVFGNPYSLKYFPASKHLLEAYEDDDMIQKSAAQLLFGAIQARGKLPVTASDAFKYGEGLLTTGPNRLKYTIPEEVGIDRTKLEGIAKIANEAINARAMPGCQVMIVKDAKVIYQQSFGYFTYDDVDAVHNDALYDIASITKVAATTLAVMFLYDQDLIDIYQNLGHYLAELNSSNKEKLLVKEVLTHQAGLKPYIPFYKRTLDNAGKLSPQLYSSISSENFTVPVTHNIFMKKAFIDTIWDEIIASPVKDRGTYVYSDLDFYFLKRIAERVSGMSLDKIVDEAFYKPLGLSHISFKPTEKFPVEQIVPSNYDHTFRGELIQGYVHDPGAAMLGGVGGHAGLFSDANDLAVLMQMLLNGGIYGGVRYLDAKTVEKFTMQQSKMCRRGLGFDKPEPDPDRASPCSKDASCNTFGHQGFTGTCVWADPEYDIIYVFLSNRTYPEDTNQKINSLNIRTRIQQVVYDAILDKAVN